MLKIVFRGRVHKFVSLSEAKRCAELIFHATGVVVAIEKA